ncbi:glucosidase [Planctomycetales bacterium ZRK34]|nr:glucosidase [Planctomycetales bacterium ZRK34]
MAKRSTIDPETRRLKESADRTANWKRWGPYLSERQWGTVREDYSADGSCWDYFPHDHARSRAYRWGEDGLLGITDRECRLCFALGLWNGNDPILKERLFGLTGPEGNHGEDVKECYYYLDAAPSGAYLKALYKYPQAAYPYDEIVAENARRSRTQPEYELADTGVFDESRYFDVTAEYAKADPNDILIRITIANRGPDSAELHLLPTLWFRNTWTWGCTHEGCTLKPRISRVDDLHVKTEHESLNNFHFAAEEEPDAWLFTDNETNYTRLFDEENPTRFTKDAFDRYVIEGNTKAVNPKGYGTKTAPLYRFTLKPGAERVFRFRLYADEVKPDTEFGPDFKRTFTTRLKETDAYYKKHIPSHLHADAVNVARQAYAGLLWSKQFYHLVVEDWFKGDPHMPAPPDQRLQHGRNMEWMHLYSRDVLSMPDKWEYPWFAAWDLAFHMIPMARVDADFAKKQLLLMLREWYMHPNGQIPAYEFAFSDVNPPVHAWACWRVYKMTAPRGKRDVDFLARCFQKLILNFTWWVNRKDPDGRNLFAGGFLGLDNIGVFDRSSKLPGGATLRQADGTAWMAFYCGTMLSMAIELAQHDPVYEDMASKFFEHFVAIVDAMNTLGGSGLWDEHDGFYYDQLHVGDQTTRMKVRSMVGLIPLCAVEILNRCDLDKLPGFKKRARWFLDNRKELARHITYFEEDHTEAHRYMLAIPSKERLTSVLRYMLDESEFLSPFGLRSLSAFHRDHPFAVHLDGEDHRVAYTPGESETSMFGGNSNWRGPIWLPLNYLIIESIERYHHFYGNDLKLEYPTGSGKKKNLREIAQDLRLRVSRLFLPDGSGCRPCHAGDDRHASDPHWKDLVLFHEYFHGDNGAGLGASHQTGWTALVINCLEKVDDLRHAK